MYSIFHDYGYHPATMSNKDTLTMAAKLTLDHDGSPEDLLRVFDILNRLITQYNTPASATLKGE